MPLVTMKEMLADARARRYAVPAFDVSNYEMIRAVVDVAQELRSPVILSALQPDLEGCGIDYYAAMTQTAAKLARVPVCIHLDHATTLDLIKQAIDYGFSSVMFDGSSLSFSENARLTREVCELAHPLGITVEAELGHVPDAIAGSGESAMVEQPECHSPGDVLTHPEEVKAFVEETGVDALAVSIGTAHGVYRETPKLDFARLDAINAISEVPLVLHGGSGTPDPDIRRTIELGICKINIFSELLAGLFGSMKDTLNGLENMSTWPFIVYRRPIESMSEVVKGKMTLFGSAGKV